MQRLSQNNSTVSLFPGIDGDVQLAIGASSGHIVLDCQGAERGSDGVLRHTHGVVRLTRDTLREMAAFIDHIDEPVDPRQPVLPAIWGDATTTQPVRPPVRHRRRRVA